MRENARMKIPASLLKELSAAGKKGGKARASKLTPAQRTAIARKAGKIRWANRLKKSA